MTEDGQKNLSKTGLSNIIAALGGGAGIAAIVATVVQISKPNIETPPSSAAINPVPTSSVPSSASEAKRLTGIWEGSSSWGDVTFRQEGAKIEGAYAYNEDGTTYYGYLKGDLTGTTFNFTWWEDPVVNSSYEQAQRGGNGYLVLTGDNQLVGRWRNEGEGDWSGDWVLNRK